MSNSKFINYDSLPEYFYHWVETTPDAVFLRQPIGDSWNTISYLEAYNEASKITKGLQKLGLNQGDHVAIYSKNCYHWILADLAIMMGGFVSIPLYFNLSPKQLEEALIQSDSKAVFVGKLDEWSELSDTITEKIKVIKFPPYLGNARIQHGIPWNDIVLNNDPLDKGYIPLPDELWTILFTSGTTGTPKGVMHVHKTPVQIVKDDHKNNWIGAANYPNPKLFSYLPLNHVGEKIGVYTTGLMLGGTISFGESIDTFARNLQDTQPTIFFSVPRIWTKFYLGVALKLSLNKQKILFKIPVVSNIIKKRIRKRIGLDQAKVIATGSAITPSYIKEWYKKLGVHLVEAYGMTEVCGSITNTPMRNAPLDSVGKPVPGCEIKIDATTSEVLMKSPYMMKGYYKHEELTARVIKDGWLHSGDKGFIDDKGFLKIIGRVSDAFKTSKGKYITPNPIEERIEKNVYVEQVCIAGLGIPQPIAIVNLSDIAQSTKKEEIEVSLDETLVTVNKELANYNKVSTLIIDRKTWNTENKLLTPTLKIKRGEVDDQFGDHYLEWHNDEKKVIWL